MIKGRNQKERLQRWINHLEGLLGRPPEIEEDESITQVLPPLVIKRGPFDINEYKRANDTIKEGKSFGMDEIRPEVLKLCDLDAIVLQLCNRALIDKANTRQWSLLNIIPIPKSGDLSMGGNYRGISISSLVAKTYNRMIMNRSRPYLDRRLRKNKNGFRSGITTTSQILALRRLIEGVMEKNIEAILIFIDFKKAFDTVHRGKILLILKSYGIPEELVTAISIMYEDKSAKVITSDVETETFSIIAGFYMGTHFPHTSLSLLLTIS